MKLVDKLLGKTAIGAYLAQCRVVNLVVEAENVHVPPTEEEALQLFNYLAKQGIQAAIVGSVGVLHYVGDQANFRPTVDLDIFTNQNERELYQVRPPAGWRVDQASPGVLSWISPRGGYVDFITSGHEFPSGEKAPKFVTVDPSSQKFPVATALDIFKLKLNSSRPKDLGDLLELAKVLGKVPTAQELGKLNDTQRENLVLVAQWIKHHS